MNRKNKNYKDNRSGRTGKNSNYSKRDDRNKRETAQDRMESERSRGEVYNDVNWYFTDKAMMDQASQFSLNQFLGNKSYPGNLQVPAVTMFRMMPTPGATVKGDQSNGINMASQRIYSQLSAITGRTSTYAPQDISTLMLELGEVLSIQSHIRRAFGLVYTYNQRNRALPQNLLQILGFDYADLFSKVSVYRTRFNTILTQLNKVPFPINIAYLAKCNDMYTSVYMDENDPMAQLYVFRPAYTWDFDEISNPDGTQLSTVALGVNFVNMQQWLDQLEKMVNALLTSSTLNIIYADILNMSNKAGVPLVAVPLLEENYSVLPVYNEGILEQIHNLSPLGNVVPSTDSGFITGCTNANDVVPDPNTNTIYWNPGIRELDEVAVVQNALGNLPIILDFFDSNPDVVRRIEATRLLAVKDYSVINTYGGTPNTKVCRVKECPDHSVVAVYTYMNDDTTTPWHLEERNMIDSSTPLTSNEVKQLSAPSGVKHFPARYVTEVDNLTSPTAIVDTFRIGDLDAFSECSIEYLHNINKLISLSLYALR